MHGFGLFCVHLMKAKKSNIFKILIGFSLLIVIAISAGYYFYKSSAVKMDEPYFFILNEGDNVETLSKRLENECGLKFPSVFKLIAKRMNLENWMKRGRYEVQPDMTLIDLVRKFREGKSKTVNFTIKELGSMDNFVKYCGERLEPDEVDFEMYLNDPLVLAKLGFDKVTIYALPIPDTYNLFWHTAPDELCARLKKEYELYWNAERTARTEEIGLTPIEVATLASIVNKETNKTDEMPMVAGMYINRLKIEMPLQADPTVKFALNQPELKRILNIHLNVESPYNTYKNKGLPPGPICIPSKKAIEAVLNYTKHAFLFMCAREDFSGYHNFSVNYVDHLKNARKYQKALDERGIQ